MAEREKDFKITTEEANKLRKAMKDEEFRKLLAEYAQEISDPENRARYERELTELERQRGVNIKFIRPTAGFVIKIFTTPEGKKIFINVCQSDTVGQATPTHVKNKGDQWLIPYSLTPPRDDLDKAGKKCIVLDAVFHPETYKNGQQNPRFKKLLVDTILEGFESNLKMKFDRSTLVYLRMPYKGVPTATVLREKTKDPHTESSEGPDLGPLKVPYPPLREEVEAKSHKKQQERKEKEKPATEPEYSIVHRGEMTMQDFTNERSSSRIRRPKELVVTVQLPGVGSAKSVELDIFEKRLLLQCNKPLYKLDLALPYPVNEDKGSAKFNKSKKSLVITLPVLPLPRPPLAPHHQDRPLVTELTSTDESSEQTNELEENESCDTNENVTEDEQREKVESWAEMVKGWSSVGEWQVPPFNYHQDDSTVSFVLYTSGVKKASMVSHFDEHQVQLTYTTASGQNFSFCVTFPSECGLDCDDCRVDLSEDNIVLVLAKDEESSNKEWENFKVGLKSAQPTAENKLFLTADNVQRAIEQMDDPWVERAGWSEAAQVEVTSLSKEQMNIKVTDKKETSPPPSSSAPPITAASEKSSRSTEISGTEKEMSHHSLNGSTEENVKPKSEQKIAASSTKEAGELMQAGRLKEIEGPEPVAVLENTDGEAVTSTSAGERATVVGTNSHTTNSGVEEEGNADTVSQGAAHGGGGGRGGDGVELVNGSSVSVESDGSVFVRADKDYAETRPLQQLDKAKTNLEKGTKIKFSNHLAFSLD